MKRENKQRVFMASLFGFDTKEKRADDIVYNGDPESVAHLSQEEREVMTQRLKAQHQKKFDGITLKPPGPND